MEIKIKLLSDLAKLPTKGSQYAAGYDLYSTEDYVLKCGERKLFKTNISINIPSGYYGRLAPRSGLAYKNGIDVLAGVIDSDYEGDIGIILLNTSKVEYISKGEIKLNEFKINSGDRIAQLIIEKCHDVEWTQVEQLDETSRGENGFGSTG